MPKTIYKEKYFPIFIEVLKEIRKSGGFMGFHEDNHLIKPIWSTHFLDWVRQRINRQIKTNKLNTTFNAKEIKILESLGYIKATNLKDFSFDVRLERIEEIIKGKKSPDFLFDDEYKYKSDWRAWISSLKGTYIKSKPYGDLKEKTRRIRREKIISIGFLKWHRIFLYEINTTAKTGCKAFDKLSSVNPEFSNIKELDAKMLFTVHSITSEKIAEMKSDIKRGMSIKAIQRKHGFYRELIDKAFKLRKTIEELENENNKSRHIS